MIQGLGLEWILTRDIVQKLSNIFSDNRVMPSDWRHMIPIFLVQQPLPIAINAKWLADGINEKIQIYGVEIPEHVLFPQEYQKEWFLDLTGDGVPDYHAVVPERETLLDPRPDQPVWINGRLVNE